MTDWKADVMGDDVADRLALSDLVDGYAATVDDRDLEAFRALFTPDARLTVSYGPGLPLEMEFNGHADLAKVMDNVSAYEKTFHFVGTKQFAITGDAATGRVYCLAHHLHRDRHGSLNFVMYIRYDDVYVRGGVRGWQMSARQLNVEWTETRMANSRSFRRTAP